MIERFGEMGVVEARDGPTDGAPFPAVIEVEDLPEGRRQALAAEGAAAVAADRVELERIEKARRFPYGLRPPAG